MQTHADAQAAAAEVQAAAADARAAQPAWRAMGFRRRGLALGKARARFVAERNAIVAAMAAEHGKSEAETYFVELLVSFDLFDYWLDNAEKLLAPEMLPLDPVKFPAKRGKIVYEPKGLIGVISTWNYPINLPLRSLIPALMAGNAVLYKPSEHAVAAGEILERIFRDALPPGVLQTVRGAGDVGAEVVDAVDHVCFTGSGETGRKVASRCAERLITCSLELGGKAAAIVLADADLDRAINGILWAKFHTAGQNCSAVERIYVAQSVAEAFTARFAEAARKLQVSTEGPWAMLPLRTPRQRDNVAHQVDQARAAGAKVLCGGAPGETDLGYQATVVVAAPEECDLLTRETFGPAVAIVPVADAAEAVRKANASDLGLSASIWTRDLELGERLAAQLEVGVAIVNNACFTGPMPFAPWGGRKLSGHGCTGSHLAVRELVHPKTILIDAEKAPHELWWYPYTPTRLGIARKLFLILSGQAGLSDVLALLRLMPRRFRDS
ncbi:MAG: aldehyde dehydrogenase family protein [Candidatus Sericytochromatia bacterium]|nr:aldehyde dehydrogenase family protein [Candidatus Tanganyikabacteria bacterium]